MRDMCRVKSTPNESSPLALAEAALEGLAWPRVFGNAHPVEVEIGTGKGGFLLRRSRALPERNFLGIEWAGKYYRYAVDRFERHRIANVRLLRTDASWFMRCVCPRASLAALHVYHPDPWPKARHHRRRLMQREFVDAAAACLAPGGRWAVQTDHAGYFEQIHTLLANHPALAEVEFDDPAWGIEDQRLDTNFEIKYRREGRPIYRIAVVRPAS